jgi:hypothetical protein
MVLAILKQLTQDLILVMERGLLAVADEGQRMQI